MSERSAAGGGLVPPAAIGFIGLGQMGIPMTNQLLQAGFTVKAYDAAPAARAKFEAKTGVSAVESAAAACHDVAAVITMLPDGKIVRDVLLGVGDEVGALAAADPGTLVIDMSSSSPVDTRALAAELQPDGYAVVDAPVSGGVKRALDGSLAIMAGGEADTVERVRPLLSAMGARRSSPPARWAPATP